MSYKFIERQPAPSELSKPYLIYRCTNCRALLVQRDPWEPPRVCGKCRR